MFTSDTKREALVENLRAAREARTQEKITKHAAEVIQVRSLSFMLVHFTLQVSRAAYASDPSTSLSFRRER